MDRRAVEDAIEGLESVEGRRNLGKLLVHWADTNELVAAEVRSLVGNMKVWNDQAARSNRLIALLTAVIALGTLIQAAYYGSVLLGAVRDGAGNGG